jgi:hypothetical protein
VVHAGTTVMSAVSGYAISARTTTAADSTGPTFATNRLVSAQVITGQGDRSAGDIHATSCAITPLPTLAALAAHIGGSTVLARYAGEPGAVSVGPRPASRGCASA